MEPILSVIVPVYNSEKVLSRCLESLKNQTNKNFCLILINDGSSDKSLDICNEHVALNDNWHVYSIINSGPSGARNFGMEQAKTQYITFIDADDYIDQNYINELLKCVENENIQLGIVNYKEIRKDRQIEHSIHISYAQAMEFIVFNYLWAPWGKIISKDIIIKKFDSDYKIAEDIHFWMDNLYHKAINFQFIDSTFYNYTVENTSITRTNTVGHNQISGLNSILDIIMYTNNSIQLFFKKYYVSLFSEYKYKLKKMNDHIDEKYSHFYKLYYRELLTSTIDIKIKLILFLKVKFNSLYYRLKGE